ncbi:MAG: hypothetical protein WD407_06250 [Rhodospirillales bacterium]
MGDITSVGMLQTHAGTAQTVTGNPYRINRIYLKFRSSPAELVRSDILQSGGLSNRRRMPGGFSKSRIPVQNGDNFLVSNASRRDGELTVTLRQPFDLIAETTAIEAKS